MEFFFSGVASPTEFAMLRAACVSRILVDPVDYPNVEGWDGDCGAYKRLKGGSMIPFKGYVRLAERESEFAFVTAYDVIGDQARSRRYWPLGIRAVPVCHWGARRSVLLKYLDEAPIVGIGGMVNTLRARGKTNEETRALERARDVALDELTELCSLYRQRLHLFGACWLRALEALQNSLASADSSKWLDGKRTRLLIFEHSKNHHLSIAPSRALGYGDWDGTSLSIENARNMEKAAL